MDPCFATSVDKKPSYCWDGRLMAPNQSYQFSLSWPWNDPFKVVKGQGTLLLIGQWWTYLSISRDVVLETSVSISRALETEFLWSWSRSWSPDLRSRSWSWSPDSRSWSWSWRIGLGYFSRPTTNSGHVLRKRIRHKKPIRRVSYLNLLFVIAALVGCCC